MISPYSDAELESEFLRARQALLAGRAEEAARAFDRLLRLSPSGSVAAPSLFNAGVARDTLGARAEAEARYAELVRRFPEHELVDPALLRRARALAYLERWKDLEALSDAILARPSLTVLAQIEGLGAKALALVSQGRVDEAARYAMRARDEIERRRLGEVGTPPLELAQVAFALGEIRKARSEEIKFVPVPPNFGEVLELRCQGLLDAQNAYTDAMRSLDAHWSAMAGYRVGQLYQRLHEDVMAVPAPKEADTLRKRQLFEGAMRLRYRVLLEKGLAMMGGTVRLGERTGESSAWVERAREAHRALEVALADEKAAMAKLPFSEAELQAALDELAKKQTFSPKPAR